MSVRSVRKWLAWDGLPFAVYLGAVAALVTFPFLLYLDAPLYYDEALFLVYGEMMLEGVQLYADLADHKPPGIFAVTVALKALFAEPYLAGRVLVYIVNLLTAAGVGYLAVQMRSRRAGGAASLLYLWGIYLPHFFGFVLLTEPFANLFLVAGTVALFSRWRLSGAAVAGVAFAVAGLFNQIALVIGLPVLVVVALRWRTKDGVDLKRAASLVGTIGVGFLGALAPVTWYFVSRGTLEAALKYTVFVPLEGYDTPFELFGHIIALLSFLPVWLLASIGFVETVRHHRATGQVESREVFLVCWMVLLGLPGATSLAGDHKLLFAFPPACLLAALVLEDGYEWLFSPPLVSADSGGTVGEHLSGERFRNGVLLASVGVVAVAGAANGFVLADLVDDSAAEQAEAADAVDELVDGQAYTLPFRHYVYYFSSDIEPPMTFAGLPYSETLTREIVADLERQQVPYVLVPTERVTETGEVARVGLFIDARERIIDYVNEHYRPVSRTDQFVVFERIESGDPVQESGISTTARNNRRHGELSASFSQRGV